MASLLEQAFEPASLDSLDLYKDVLQCSRDSTPAQLRKAYYKQAKQYHPDKNDSETAKIKFQAISWTYNYLKDPTKRQEYDQEGVIPREDEDYDDDDIAGGKKSWKDYFDLIFGKLSTDDIDNFAMKYKMSEEEEKDVLENYTKFQGNLVKMLEYVMLSEERDVKRWVEDYIQPAIAAGKVENYDKALKKAMAQIDKKLANENPKSKKPSQTTKKKAAPKDDPDETETEESDNDAEGTKPTAAKAAKKAAPPTKAKPTKSKAKKKSKQSSDADLIAMIRNKKGRANPLASIAARYGVSGDFEDDPLDDAAFAKIQSNMKKRKK